MQVKVQYKRDDADDISYCAFTYIGEKYRCAWSGISFEEAKKRLIEKLKAEKQQPLQPVPSEELIEI